MLSLTAAVAGVTPERTALSPPDSERYERLAQSLVAPCCWRQALADHESEKAREARGELVALIAAGRSDREILDHFVEQYGARILMVPEGKRGQWLFWTPWIVLAAAMAAAAYFLSRVLRGRNTRAAIEPSVDIDDNDLDW